MLNRADLVNKLQACADGNLSINDLEDWFEDESWDVHQSGDEQLTKFVFRIESWLTARNEGRLGDGLFREKVGGLVKSARPFASSRTFVLKRPPLKSWVLTSSAVGSIGLVRAATS